MTINDLNTQSYRSVEFFPYFSSSPFTAPHDLCSLLNVAARAKLAAATGLTVLAFKITVVNDFTVLLISIERNDLCVSIMVTRGAES